MSYENNTLGGFASALRSGSLFPANSSENLMHISGARKEDISSNIGNALKSADKLNSDAALFEATVTNAYDGATYAAAGTDAVTAVAEVNEELQVLAEIASQNNISLEYRTALDDEAQALITEHARIKSNSEFNGSDVLQDSGGSIAVKVGSKEHDSITIVTGQAVHVISYGSSNLLSVSASEDAATNFSTHYGYLENDAARFSAATESLGISIDLNQKQATDLRNTADNTLTEQVAENSALNVAQAVRSNRVSALLAQSALDPQRVASLLEDIG